MEEDGTMEERQESMISLDRRIFTAWQEIGENKRLASHSDIAAFLIQFYQGSLAGENLLRRRCRHCNAFLALLCPHCYGDPQRHRPLDPPTPESATTSATTSSFPENQPSAEEKNTLLFPKTDPRDSRLTAPTDSGRQLRKRTELKFVLPLATLQQSLAEDSDSEPDLPLRMVDNDQDSDGESTRFEDRMVQTFETSAPTGISPARRGRKQKAIRGRRVVRGENVAEGLRQHIKEEVQDVEFEAEVSGVAGSTLRVSDRESSKDKLKKEAEEYLDDSNHGINTLLEEVALMSQSVVNGKKCFTCQRCDAEFATCSQMKRHFMTHMTGLRPNSCEHCGVTFQSSSNLLRHIRNKHPEIADEGTAPQQAEEISVQVNTLGTESKQQPEKEKVEIKKETTGLTDNAQSQSRSNRLPCELCGKTFSSRRGLKRHELTHTNHRPFQCKICSTSFTRMTHLKRHVLQKHLQSQCTHVCSLCSAPFADSYHLMRHMDSHTDHKPHSCPQCDATFTTSRQLKTHLQSHSQKTAEIQESTTSRLPKTRLQSLSHTTNEMQNSSQERSYSSSSDTLIEGQNKFSSVNSGDQGLSEGMSESVNDHTVGSDRLDVGQATNTETNTRSHSRTLRQDMFSSDDISDKQDGTNQNSSSHSTTQNTQPSESENINSNLPPGRKLQTNKLLTSETDSQPSSSSNEKRHEKAEFAWLEYAVIHPSANAVSGALSNNVNLALKVCACTHPGCTRTFSCPSDLKRHELNHSGERPYLCKHCGQSFKRPNAMKRHERRHLAVKPFKCELCSETFLRQTQLTRHSRKHHGQKPYVCVECGEAFREPANLTRHTRKHTGEKPYVCEWCGMPFTQAGNLKKHISARHTGYKPHKCKHCGKGYTTTYLLAVHIRSHTGERPFVCKECGAGFRVISHLKDHMLKHTGERPKQCPLCPNTYTRSSHVKKHIRRMHPEHDPLTATQTVLSNNAVGNPLFQACGSFTSTP